jgi:ubiquinol-cytochrome c reductase iron-sulfur subunit
MSADERPPRAKAVPELEVPTTIGESDSRQAKEGAAKVSESAKASHAEQPSRRDFLVIAANTFAAVGTAFAMWPFIAQMSPDASMHAVASIEVDLAPVATGQAITVTWRGKPIFIRNRTQDEIEQARAVPLSELPDPSPTPSA